MRLFALRGAASVDRNDAEAILRATEQLLLSLHVREGAELSTLRAAIVRAGERCGSDGPEHGTRRSVARRARAVAAAEATREQWQGPCGR